MSGAALASDKSRPDEAVRLGIDACAAAGIKLDVDLRLVALACRYSSGTMKTPDYDVADAFVALCTAILHEEYGCRQVLAPDPTWQERLVKERGRDLGPDHHDERTGVGGCYGPSR